MAFKSEVHVAELASVHTGHTEGDIYYILDNGMLGDLPCKPGDFVEWHSGTWQIRPNEHYALASTVEDGGKLALFEAGERFTNFPTFAQIRAEISNGKTAVIKTSDGETWYLISSNSSYCYFEGASDWFQIRVDDSNNWTTTEKYDDTFNSQSHNAVQSRALYSLLIDEDSSEGFRELKFTYENGLQFVKTHPSTKILSEGFPVDSADYKLVRTFNGFIYKNITGWKVDGTVTVGLWNYDTKQYVAEVAISSTSEQSPDTIAALTKLNASDEMELHVKGSGTIGAIVGAI